MTVKIRQGLADRTKESQRRPTIPCHVFFKNPRQLARRTVRGHGIGTRIRCPESRNGLKPRLTERGPPRQHFESLRLILRLLTSGSTGEHKGYPFREVPTPSWDCNPPGHARSAMKTDSKGPNTAPLGTSGDGNVRRGARSARGQSAARRVIDTPFGVTLSHADLVAMGKRNNVPGENRAFVKPELERPRDERPQSTVPQSEQAKRNGSNFAAWRDLLEGVIMWTKQSVRGQVCGHGTLHMPWFLRSPTSSGTRRAVGGAFRQTDPRGSAPALRGRTTVVMWPFCSTSESGAVVD